MEFWLVMLLLSLPSIIEGAYDPLNGLLQADEAAWRALDCTPMRVEGARVEAPGRITEVSPRGDFMERRAVICRERLMIRGERRPRDEVILSQLRHRAAAVAALIDALPASARDRTWLVEVVHPDRRVAYKISFAVKNSLLDKGLRVSDRTPQLTAGDIQVLGEARPSRAYTLACARVDLGPSRGLLTLALRDPRETIMHAGICLDGRWRWLR